jgi:hypothetical protein
VKITGANFNSSSGCNEQQQQLTGLLMCNSEVKNKEGVEDGSVLSSGSPDDASVSGGAFAVNTLMGQETAQVVGYSNDGTVHLESGTPDISDDDEDFLDLLVDTLDGDFDPNLLI